MTFFELTVLVLLFVIAWRVWNPPEREEPVKEMSEGERAYWRYIHGEKLK